ncbi:MAG TPA: hypothetical protein VH858_17700 [Hyphomicrobiales bacterium]|jgi:hypothetical protein
MALSRCKLRYAAMGAVVGAALVVGGCEGSGVDFEFNAPILEAAGLNLTSKKKQDENVPERPGLVLPPSTDKLPEPGTHTAAASPRQAWPQDADQIRKQREAELAAAEQAYCKDGQWPEKMDITEFNKATGREPRCQSNFGKALSKAVGGGPATARQ